MNDNAEVLELLRRIDRSGRQRTVCMWILCILALVAVIFCGLLISQVRQIIPQLNDVLVQMGEVMTQMEDALGNISEVAEALSDLDLETMVSDVGDLVKNGQDSLALIMTKLNTLSFDTLNEAIEDLASIIKPLAKFFGKS